MLNRSGQNSVVKGGSLVRVSLALITAVTTAWSSPSQAQLTCSQVFTGQSATAAPTQAVRPVAPRTEVRTDTQPRTEAPASDVQASSKPSWFRSFRKPVEFDAEVSERIKLEFVEKLSRGEKIDPLQLKTLNEKVAWVDANGVMQGPRGDFFYLTRRFQDATPAEKRMLHRTFKNLDFSQKISWSQADRLVTKLYLLVHFDPANYGILQIFKTKWDNGVSDLIRHRTGLSVARYGMIKGLTDQGFLKSQTSIDRFRQKLRPWMMPVDIAWSTALSTLSFYVPFMGTRVPKLLLRTKDLTPEQNQKFFDQGWDLVRADAENTYGRSAKIQHGLSVAERTLAVLFIPIMAAIFFDDLKYLGMLAYTHAAPNDPLHLIDEKKQEALYKQEESKKLKLTPARRKQLIDYLYERDRQGRIQARDPYPMPEQPWEKEERIAAVDEELKESNHRAHLETLPDSQIDLLAKGGSVGMPEEES